MLADQLIPYGTAIFFISTFPQRSKKYDLTSSKYQTIAFQNLSSLWLTISKCFKHIFSEVAGFWLKGIFHRPVIVIGQLCQVSFQKYTINENYMTRTKTNSIWALSTIIKNVIRSLMGRTATSLIVTAFQHGGELRTVPLRRMGQYSSHISACNYAM